MPARREAADADVVRIDIPLLGLAAHEADGALGIQERTEGGEGLGFSGTAWYPILEDDPGDPLGAEPFGDLRSLQIPGQVPVPAPGTHDECRAGVLAFGRPVDRERRMGHS